MDSRKKRSNNEEIATKDIRTCLGGRESAKEARISTSSRPTCKA